jgi:hypothetical protein
MTQTASRSRPPRLASWLVELFASDDQEESIADAGRDIHRSPCHSTTRVKGRHIRASCFSVSALRIKQFGR